MTIIEKEALIELIKNSDIDATKKKEIIELIKSKDRKNWTRAVIIIMEAIKVAQKVWESFDILDKS